MIRIPVLMLAVSSCTAQHFAVGVKVGSRLTGDLEGTAVSESRLYIAGPAVEVGLTRRFGVEVDALYRRFGYRSGNSDSFGGFVQTSERAHVWEFPMVVKYRLGAPYAVLGYSPRVMTGGASHTVGVNVTFAGARSPYEFSGSTGYDVTHGLVAGGGVEFGGRHFRVAPEVRFTFWNADLVALFGSRGFHVNSPQHEVKLLLGLRWR